MSTCLSIIFLFPATMKRKWVCKVEINILYCTIITLCSKILKSPVGSPCLVFSMFDAVSRCYCYTGIKFVLPECLCGTERIRLSIVLTSTLHPTRTHATHADGEPRTQPRLSGTNKHTKNTNYAYPNTPTP